MSQRKQNFLEAAENAFSYENHWFNEQINNWPDFRIEKGILLSKKNTDELTYSSAWCHGAPGIGLSRIRAYDLLKDDKYLKDSNLSINTCIKILEQNISKNNNNSNNSNITMIFHYVMDYQEYVRHCYMQIKYLKDNTYRLLAENIGFYGIENYLNSGVSWPCGIKGGETPGLMLGIGRNR